MEVLHGIVAPPGDGKIIEVHLDIMDAPDDFLRRLTEFGFESDPFLEFYPPEYTQHYTGRTRAPKSNVGDMIHDVQALIEQVMREANLANVSMYVESELVRKINHFDKNDVARNLDGIADFTFQRSASAHSTKADVHVEFRSGTVPNEVRCFLLSKLFYWVRTPQSSLFPSEEIATLQTSRFNDAREVFDRLVASPLPACTGIHLEQKLAMIPSYPDLPMPGAVEVTRRR